MKKKEQKSKNEQNKPQMLISGIRLENAPVIYLKGFSRISINKNERRY